MPENNEKGAGLVEAMISMVIFLVVTLGALGLVDRFQSLAWNLNLLQEKEANITAAPLLLARWVLPAGNNRFASNRVGVSGDPKTLEIRSDIDGPSGFPDGTLAQSYEAIAIRRNGSDLQVKSDQGTFQPVLKNVSQLEFRAELPVIEISIAGQVDRRTLAMSAPPVVDQTTMRFYAWNYRRNLFAEEP